jgi:hypothetical protein
MYSERGFSKDSVMISLPISRELRSRADREGGSIMPSVTCWQCGERFSDLDLACPKCGALSVNVLPTNEIEELEDQYNYPRFNPSEGEYEPEVDLPLREWF